MDYDLKAVELRCGMLIHAMQPEDLPAKSWHAPGIPAVIEKALIEEDLFSLGGIYGDRNAGIPVEYDNMRLVTAGGTVEITVFNRGITLFMTDDERVQRIHRVLCKASNVEG